MDVESKLFKPPGECMNTDKEENRKMRERIVEGKTKTLESFMNEKLV